MAEEKFEQKTEEATSKRIRDAQRKGNFALSREVTSVFVLLGAMISLMIAGPMSLRKMMETWRQIFSQSWSIQLTLEETQRLSFFIFDNVMGILGPIMLAIFVAGIAANLIQTEGLKFSLHPLVPNFGKINPINGVKRIFSMNALMELFKSVFKIAVISAIAFFTIRSRFDEIVSMMGLSPGQILMFLGEITLEILFKVLLAMVLLSVLDFSFQRYIYKKNLRMTKQEVKEERKETEGHPIVKQRIRTVQIEMVRKRMMAEIGDADVVVTDSHDIAVAIRYDKEKLEAPYVLGKGKGHLAERISDLARENGVPLVEDKTLAQSLYKTADIGQIIPERLYRAVAEILAYAYRLKGKTSV